MNGSAKKFNFRLRFFVPKGTELKLDAPEAELPPATPNTSLTLKPLFSETIKGAERLYITGKGFSSESAAAIAGLRTKAALLLASAESRIGVNCGRDKVTLQFSEEIKKELELDAGVKLHDDVHGLYIYPDEGNDRFISMKGEMTVGRSADRFLASFENFSSQAPTLSDRHVIALELVNSSHFEITGRARFLTLVTAIEVLCERKRSSDAIQGLVDVALKAVAAYPEGQDRQSVINRISDIKKESIARACKSHIGNLLGMEAASQFGKFYNARGEIIHEGKFVEELETMANEAHDLTWKLLTHGLRTLDE